MKFKSKFFLAPILTISLAAAPLTPAFARGHGHGGYGGGYHGGGGYHRDHGFGAGALIGGLIVGTALLLTAPIRAVGDAVEPVDYYQPQEAEYIPAQRPVYTREYVQAPPTYYSQPAPRYYQQAPNGSYYAPAAAYYPY